MRPSKESPLFGLGLLVLLFVVYSNHFDNGFYFDDSHTISSHKYITDLSSIPKFFVDSNTYGSLPPNASYRPVVTTLNAIDVWLAGGERNPLYLHATTFFWYVV